MSGIKTKTTPVDQLVAGVNFIPKGRQRPVTIALLSDFHGATVDVYAYSKSGQSAHILSRYDTVEVVVVDR